jgi:hypothetical protein
MAHFTISNALDIENARALFLGRQPGWRIDAIESVFDHPGDYAIEATQVEPSIAKIEDEGAATHLGHLCFAKIVSRFVGEEADGPEVFFSSVVHREYGQPDEWILVDIEAGVREAAEADVTGAYARWLGTHGYDTAEADGLHLDGTPDDNACDGEPELTPEERTALEVQRMEPIADLRALAAHLGADLPDDWTDPPTEAAVEKVSARIGHRLFKDTECGVGSSVGGPGAHATGTQEVRWAIRLEDGPTGIWHLAAWLRQGTTTSAGMDRDPVPDWLASCLCLDAPDRTVCPSDHGCRGRAWLYDSFIASSKIGVKPYIASIIFDDAGADLVLVMDEPVLAAHTGVLSVAGYCEGSDCDHVAHVVYLPCTAGEVDDAVTAADRDGNETWDQTHACADCWGGKPQVTELGEMAIPGEGACPVDPDCLTCKGDGAVF